MTHHTDAERAEFEAWYIKSAQKAVPAFSAWSDIEVRDGCMRPDGKSYKIDTARIAWEAWQAARRAPVVPQCPFPCGWKNLHKLVVAEGAFLAKSLNECEPITTHQRDVVMRVVHYGIEMARSMLAAAPQPPEAAPVELPEPAIPGSQGVCCGNFTTGGYYMGQHEQVCCGCPDDAHPPYYTEQQVRELLANHGIQERST